MDGLSLRPNAYEILVLSKNKGIEIYGYDVY